ncbi:MAG: hypothetical protein V2J26_04095 [Pacificimonas sp.]|jgi:hypothetical protein|nr:hypothetical protein [Pacificimonas sp.]
MTDMMKAAREKLASARAGQARTAAPTATATTATPKTWLGAPRWATALVGFFVFLVLYFGVAAWVMDDRRADTTMRPAPEALPPGGSATIAYAASLIEQELDRGGWTPNDSFLSPTAALTRMPAFQTAVVDMVRAVTNSYTDTQTVEALARASSELAVEPERGFFNGSFPFIGGSAGARYGNAADELVVYNTALATDQLSRPGDSETLRALLETMLTELRRVRGDLDDHIRGEDETGSESLAYEAARGESYAATLLLRGVRSDFAPLIRERRIGSALVEAIEALDAVAAENASFVGTDDLTSQGYFLASAIDALARAEAELEPAA